MGQPIVTIGDAPTPTQQVVADANRVVEVTDARQRVLGVRRMNMSIRRRVYKSLTNAALENNRYMGLVMVAACVVTINREPADALTMGANELVFDSLIDRLDDDGFEAVGKAIADNFAPPITRDEIKNE